MEIPKSQHDMNRRTLLSLIQKKFGQCKFSPEGEEVQVNCPFCAMRGQGANHTFKLYININKGLFNCFRCEAAGRIGTLFPQLIALEVNSGTLSNQLDLKEKNLEQLPQMKTLDNLSYPWDRLVYGFLNDRNFPPVTLTDRVFFVEDYKKNNFSFGPRLIFPIHQFGTYRGFQGRTIYNNTAPKYIGATNMDRRSILYNYDVAFSQSKQLVITEGFFDCIRVGDTAVATLGKQITENQLRLIRLGDFKRVIVFLDRDAEIEATNLAEKICQYFPTYIAYPTKKDPGEMTREEINFLLDNLHERIY